MSEKSTILMLLVVWVSCVQAGSKGKARKNVLHLTIDKNQSGYYGNPVLRTNATVTEALAIKYWTQYKNNRDNNRHQTFAVYHSNNGTITILEDGVYNIYTSLGFYRYRRSYSQYMVSLDNKVIKKCKRADKFEIKNGDGKWMLISMCQTDGIFYFYKDQNLSIRSGNVDWRIVTNIDVTYWGLIKL